MRTPRSDVVMRRFMAGEDVAEIARKLLVAEGWTFESPTWRSDIAAKAVDVEAALRRATVAHDLHNRIVRMSTRAKAAAKAELSARLDSAKAAVEEAFNEKAPGVGGSGT